MLGCGLQEIRRANADMSALKDGQCGKPPRRCELVTKAL